jgi:hypothetical protein
MGSYRLAHRLADVRLRLQLQLRLRRPCFLEPERLRGLCRHAPRRSLCRHRLLHPARRLPHYVHQPHRQLLHVVRLQRRRVELKTRRRSASAHHRG